MNRQQKFNGNPFVGQKNNFNTKSRFEGPTATAPGGPLYSGYEGYDEYLLNNGLEDPSIVNSHREWVKELQTNNIPLSRLASKFDPEDVLTGYGLKYAAPQKTPYHGIMDSEQSLYSAVAPASQSAGASPAPAAFRGKRPFLAKPAAFRGKRNFQAEKKPFQPYSNGFN
jgi:hypothetical protein